MRRALVGEYDIDPLLVAQVERYGVVSLELTSVGVSVVVDEGKPPAEVARLVAQLTGPQRSALAVFVARHKMGMAPPTMRELCAGLGMSSTNAAAEKVASLTRLGLLVKPATATKRIRSVCLAPGVYGAWLRACAEHGVPPVSLSQPAAPSA